MQLVYKGSVKDLYQDGERLIFDYSDRYSIFDWGEMPDQIPHKGEALAAMASLFFEYLKSEGIDSHYVKKTSAKQIEVQPVQVLRPKWEGQKYDYSMYASKPTHCLVPLEVIFRRHLGQGNSLEGRLKKNPSYMQELGMTSMPQGAVSFDPALVEVSTKLETSDRYLTKAEVKEMNVISEGEMQDMRARTTKIVQKLESLFASFGVKLWDGKVEFGFQEKGINGERSLMLVDSIGPDELRLTYEGLPLSKEFLRQIYGNSDWSNAVKKAKDLAAERHQQDWKKICEEELGQKPQKLSLRQIEVSSLLYQALANEIALKLSRPLPFSPEKNLKLWHSKVKEVVGS